MLWRENLVGSALVRWSLLVQSAMSTAGILWFKYGCRVGRSCSQKRYELERHPSPAGVFYSHTHRVVSVTVLQMTWIRLKLTGLMPKTRSHHPAHLRTGRQEVRARSCALSSLLHFMPLLGVLGTNSLQPNYQPELIKGIPNCMNDASQECLQVEILKILLFMRNFYMLTFSKSRWGEQSPTDIWEHFGCLNSLMMFH